MYVRVVDGEVTQVWDTPPPEEETGWRSAIEIRPSLIPNRQNYTGTHTFDLTADPVEIVYGVEDLTVNARKNMLIDNAKFEYQIAARQQTQLEIAGDGMDVDVLIAAKTVKDSKIAAINNCSTHDELDDL
tara:strand:- start:1154 stop:1543 length:390 start_codon:yes stop_codon:yes gene_type:complete